MLHTGERCSNDTRRVRDKFRIASENERPAAIVAGFASTLNLSQYLAGKLKAQMCSLNRPRNAKAVVSSTGTTAGGEPGAASVAVTNFGTLVA